MEFSFAEMIFAILNFAVLLVVLKFTLFKILAVFMVKRRQGIDDALNDAAAARREAASAKDMIAGEIAAARRETMDLISDAKYDALRLRDEILAEARNDAAVLLEKAEKEIAREREYAFAALKKDVADMTVFYAAALLNEILTPEKQEELKAKVLRQMEESVYPLQ
jgi:F-type H+-transporting ATPase subunit b